MRRPELRIALLAGAIAASGACAQAEEHFGIGRPATPQEIKGWDIDIGRDGSNLPPGSGSVRAAALSLRSNAPPAMAIRGRAASAIAWSAGRARSRPQNRCAPWAVTGPYAPTLFDYIRRAMPQNAPQSLSNEDVYAVSAYILNLNGLVPAEATLDAKTLAAIKMPNRNDFVPDPRPDVK